MNELFFDCGEYKINCNNKPIIMGILNITPDSFSDGGIYNNIETAISEALKMQEEGAGIIDIGGESTRPDSDGVSEEEEQKRIIPIITALKEKLSIPISVDTWHADTAEKAIWAGASIINDVGGLEWDKNMLKIASSYKVGIIPMHSRGTPKTMSKLTNYDNLVEDLITWWKNKIEECEKAGINFERLMFDPGIGFAKNAQQNLELIKATETFRSIGRPVLIAPSRKRFIGEYLDIPNPQDRDPGTIGACIAAMHYKADVLRVHNVEAVSQACKMAKILDL